MGEEIFVDANIFLEIFLDDSMADSCEKFLKSLNEDDKPFTSDFLIYSCLIAIERKHKNKGKLLDALRFFSSFSQLRILRPSIEDLYNAASMMDKHNLDFDDSLVLSCMQKFGIRRLASLDRHFDKIKNIEIVFK